MESNPVCPGRPNVTFRVIQALAKELPGVHIPVRSKSSDLVEPILTGYLNVVARGNFIIGRDEENKLFPIYDSDAHYIKMEIESKKIKRMSADESSQYGMFAYLPCNTVMLVENPRQPPRSPTIRIGGRCTHK
ncbi:uncharacterized protein LOC117181456 [Belonocnema kinseyi]|uniref:uncharacterized protein LOC117181456 n=1 Tax=Belonocnema kinseyi TaxID=2817044 RepID=UPI00143CED16|nr:uncharacterized protein LOC117181456 [Belonocnema kinseyi]